MGLMTHKKRTHWSQEETEKLQRYYNRATREDLLKLFPDRSYDSILKKANKIGVAKKSTWTEADVKILRRMYPYSTMKTLVETFESKSESAIRSKAKILKLKKDSGFDERKENKGRANSWSNYEDSILKTHFPIGGYLRVKEHLPSRTASSIQNRAKKIGVKYDVNELSLWERIEEETLDVGINRRVKVVYKQK